MIRLLEQSAWDPDYDCSEAPPQPDFGIYDAWYAT
jgi:hypothetical protein